MNWEPVPPHESAFDSVGTPVFVDPKAEPGAEEELHSGSPSRLALWWHTLTSRPHFRVAAVAIVVAGAVTAGLIGWHRHQVVRADNALAFRVAPIHEWIADDRAWGVNPVTDGGGGGCIDVDRTLPVVPEQRVVQALTSTLPGFAQRGVVRTIDEAGRLCMMQVSVRDAAGTVVVFRAEPPSDQPIRADGSSSSAVRVSGSRATGWVAAPSSDGWTVVVGWTSASDAQPDQDTLLRLAKDETAHW